MSGNFGKPLAMLAMSLAIAAPARGATLFSDNFDAENGGATALNYTGFANFSVTSPPGGNGSVDLVRTGDYGITCAGGSGMCVDLDGSTSSAGGLITKNAFAFTAGQRVTLSFDFSGNQRGGADDAIFFGFQAAGLTDFRNVMVSTGASGSMSLGDVLGQPALVFGLGGIHPTDPFDHLTFSFTAGGAGSIQGLVGDATATPANPVTDNMGVVLDNFAISAVPEPGSWALMLGGLGLAGLALRRRERPALA